MPVTKEQIAEWTRRHRHSPRVLFVVEPINSFGHARVLQTITDKTHQLGTRVGIASSSQEFAHVTEYFDFDGGVDIEDTFGLPNVATPIVNGRSQQVTPKGTVYGEDLEFQRERAQAVLNVVQKFQPDLVVFDTHPFMFAGSYRRDDLNALIQHEFYDTRLICLSREIVYDGRADETVQILNSHFDRILVRGDGVIQRLEDCQEEWRSIDIPIEYCGNVVRDLPSRYVRRGQLPSVIVTSGGGYIEDHDLRFFETAIRARRYSLAFSSHPWILVVPAKCPAEIVTRLEELIRINTEKPYVVSESIIISRSMQDSQFLREISNSAAIVGRGGYNTSLEALRAEVPLLVVPLPLVWREQMTRAEALEGLGLAATLSQSELEGDVGRAARKLASALDRAAQMPRTVVNLNLNGAERISSRLTELACARREEGLGRVHSALRRLVEERFIDTPEGKEVAQSKTLAGVSGRKEYKGIESASGETTTYYQSGREKQEDIRSTIGRLANDVLTEGNDLRGQATRCHCETKTVRARRRR
jgi:predicted glycosyltransferase